MGEILNLAPRLLQAVFAAAGDMYTFKLARKILGQEAGLTAVCVLSVGTWCSRWAKCEIQLLLSLGSAFHWFCSTRTFSNSLETSLTIIALYYWPWPLKWEGSSRVIVLQGPETNFKLSLCLAATACILRPTNILIWAIPGIFLYLKAPSKQEKLSMVITASQVG